MKQSFSWIRKTLLRRCGSDNLSNLEKQRNAKDDTRAVRYSCPHSSEDEEEEEPQQLLPLTSVERYVSLRLRQQFWSGRPLVALRTLKMERLIPLVNRLQDICAAAGGGESLVQLPQIAVVGSQSSGKSSVLEALVGEDFLPRGNGIITRRPLILQLRNVALKADEPSSASSEENAQTTLHNKWGEFGHLPGCKFYDFSKIKQEIENETDRITGKAKLISSDPILLRIYSPSVIDLTLIDLPGITKVPVGEQPPDIEAQIRRVVLSFIRQVSCLILAVTAANTDLANSDGLHIAREVDPEGKRTVGVLTKCDLMDSGTDACEALANRIYPLQLGYVAVVCRSQKDAANGLSLSQVKAEETRFFETHPAYRRIAARCGTSYLAVVLNFVLIRHIRGCLPELRHRLQSLLTEAEAEARLFHDPLRDVEGNAGALLLQYFAAFSRNFQDAIDGRLAGELDQLTGGARLHFIFHDWFARTLGQFDPLDGLNDPEIRIAIRNATGPKASLFVPEGAFEVLVRKQIQKLLAPSLQCVEQVYEELQRIVERCELAEMVRFSVLRGRVLSVVSEVLRRCLPPTSQMIHNLIQMEMAYLNTSHPDFIAKALLFADERKQDERREAAPPQERRVLPPQHMAAGLVTADCLKDVAMAVGGATKTRKMREEESWKEKRGLIRTGLKLPQLPSIVVPSDDMSERDRHEITIIKSVIISYFSIVRKNVADYVPKAIMSFMVNQAKDVLQRELVSNLYKTDLFPDLLRESDDMAVGRQKAQERVAALQAATDVVGQLKDFELEDITAVEGH